MPKTDVVKRPRRAKVFPVNTIATHKGAHFDEILAVFIAWMLQVAEKLYPGINNSCVIFWDAGTGTPDGRTAKQWLEESQTLCIGVGDGNYNEHPTEEKRREKGECAATLFARGIGVDQLDRLKPLLDYARDVDLGSVRNDHDLSLAIKRMHMCPDLSPQQVFDWAMMAILVKFEESRPTGLFNTDVIARLIKCRFLDRFDGWAKQLADLDKWEKKQWDDAAEEFKTKAVITRYRGFDYLGQLKDGLKIVTVRSGNKMMAKFVRSKDVPKIGGKDLRADITIIQKPTGHVAILGNKHSLRDVAKAIKAAEFEKRGDILPRHWNRLAAEGTHGVWHYAPDGEFLLNGSNTTSTVPPTTLSLEEITELVRLALSVTEFAKSREDKCNAGICTSSAKSPCPWFDYGLKRCLDIRFIRAKARAEAA